MPEHAHTGWQHRRRRLKQLPHGITGAVPAECQLLQPSQVEHAPAGGVQMPAPGNPDHLDMTLREAYMFSAN